MNEGASQCAGGIPGACDAMYYPAYLWPGVALLIVMLVGLGLFILFKNPGLKKSFVMLGLWLLVALFFGVVVQANTETEGDRTRSRAETCRASDDPACEY